MRQLVEDLLLISLLVYDIWEDLMKGKSPEIDGHVGKNSMSGSRVRQRV